MLWRTDESMDNHDHDPDPDASFVNVRKDSFNINVTVRFKPLDAVVKDAPAKTVTLPLHQRLALIRLENNLSSNREALNILMREGEWFKDKWSAAEEDERDQLNAPREEETSDREEVKKSLTCGVNSIDCENNNVVVVDPTKGLRSFHFDHVLADTCT